MDFEAMIRELRNEGAAFDDIIDVFNKAVDLVAEDEENEYDLSGYDVETLLRAVGRESGVPADKMDDFVKAMQGYIKLFMGFDTFWNGLVKASSMSERSNETKIDADAAEKAIKEFLDMLDGGNFD